MNRCTKCILPVSYPGLTFDQSGVCDRCQSYQPIQYQGKEALKEKIVSYLATQKDRNPDYDCVIGVSGGRDSTYLLYYMVRELNLRVLAYSIDNGFIPPQTTSNLKEMVDILGVKMVMEKNERMEKVIRHHVKAFIKRPSVRMIEMLCTGCRAGLGVMINNFARQNRVPLIISGGNPTEIGGHKERIMMLNPNAPKISAVSLLLGYAGEVLKNPMWVTNPTALGAQLEEYPRYFYTNVFRFAHRTSETNMAEFMPFFSHIKWDEKVLISTIKEKLRWRATEAAQSTWRGDCDVAIMKLYLWNRMAGYSDRDAGLANLVRDGQVPREEALQRIEKEGNIPDEVMEMLLAKVGLKFSDLKAALARQGY